jgi:hypothetical protein
MESRDTEKSVRPVRESEGGKRPASEANASKAGAWQQSNAPTFDSTVLSVHAGISREVRADTGRVERDPTDRLSEGRSHRIKIMVRDLGRDSLVVLQGTRDSEPE